MHWFIDFVLLAVLLTYTFRHFRLGLMHTVFSVLKFVLSVIAAVILTVCYVLFTARIRQRRIRSRVPRQYRR